jgi:hypothetical protein
MPIGSSECDTVLLPPLGMSFVLDGDGFER